MYQKIKSWVYNLLSDDENNLAANIFDGVIISLIILNIADIVIDTFSDLPILVYKISDIVEVVSVIIFTVEYAARIWTADNKLKYITSFMAIVDLLAILPFYIPFIIPIDLRILRTLRLIRVLRILKLNRYTTALMTIGQVIKSKSAQLISSVSVVLILMIISSIIIYYVENPAQPDVFKDAFSGLWWAVATFTTVGYGDIFPITSVGKIFSAFIAVLGIGLVAVPTGIISAGFVEGIDHSGEKPLTENEHGVIDVYRGLSFEEKNKAVSFMLEMKDKKDG
jgi:voltage-gated potassium channel